MKILRWILFLPIAFIGAGLGTKILLFVTPRAIFGIDDYVNAFTSPFAYWYIFYIISFYIIPSTDEVKTRLPFIFITIGSFIFILFISFLLFGYFASNAKDTTLIKDIVILFLYVGAELLVFIYSIYVLTHNEEAKKIEENCL